MFWAIVAVLLAQLAARPSSDPKTAHVVHVADGDTITVERDGQREKVRYIGVDTPETVKPGEGVQCFGPAASSANKRLVSGRDVRLVFDREMHDRYGRTLAYVEVDGRDVGAQLLAGGYARAKQYAPNTARAGRYARLERSAGRHQKGLWRKCQK